MADYTREVIVNAQVETHDSDKELDKVGKSADKAAKGVSSLDKETELLNKSFEDIVMGTGNLSNKFADLEKKIKLTPKTLNGLNAQMEAYKAIALQAERTDPIRQQAIDRAAALKDQYTDLENEIGRLANDHQKLQGVMEIGAGVAAGYGAFQSVLALTGSESEELEKSLQKLMAIQTLLNSANQIKVIIEKESNALLLIRNAREKIALATTEAQTAATVKGTIATKANAVAMRILNAVMSANPVFLLVAGVGALIGAYALWSSSTEDMITEQEALNETIDAYKQGAKDAVTKTNEVKVAFDLARKGVISKEEALQKYNSQLGDTFGKAKDLNEAERIFAEKTPSYIKAASLRAQANALLEKAADEQAKALTAQLENNVEATDLWKDQFKIVSDLFSGSAETIKKIQQDETKSVQEESNKRADIYTQAAEDILLEAETIEAANGITSESEKQLEDERKRRAEQARKRAQELEKQRIESLKKQADETAAFLLKIEEMENAYLDSKLSKQDQELNAVREKYFAIIEEAKKNGHDITILMEAQAEEEKQITDRVAKERADQAAEIAKRDSQALLELNLLLAEQNSQAMIDAQKELWEFEKEQLLANTELTESERLLIIEQYRKKEQELEEAMAEQSKKTQAQKYEYGLQAAKNSFDTISNIAEIFAGESEKSQKRAFEIQKAAGIANAVIDTYKAATAAYSSLAGVPVVGPVLGGIAAGAAITAGLANVKKIASTKFESASASGASSGGGGADSFNFSQGIVNASPQVELFGQANSGSDIFAGGNKSQSGSQTINVTANVVETEFTAAQNEAKATNDFLTM